MGPLLAAGLVGGGLSILGGIAGNSRITRQANENFNATLNTLDQKRSVEFANLASKGQDLNAAIGLQLTQLGVEQRQAAAKQTVNTTERNVYGQTARRLQAQVAMDASSIADNIVQKGEASMKDIQMELTNSNYAYNSGTYQASQQRANMLAQRKSGFELLAGGVSAGMSFASAGYSMGMR